MDKFRELNRALSAAYDLQEPELLFRKIDGSHSGASHYTSSRHQIVMMGKLSVVTFLHEYAHARGMDERSACRWSINLFRRVFPRQFGRLVDIGHTVVRPADVAAEVVGRRAS
jgi:hypothetical protein